MLLTFAFCLTPILLLPTGGTHTIYRSDYLGVLQCFLFLMLFVTMRGHAQWVTCNFKALCAGY